MVEEATRWLQNDDALTVAARTVIVYAVSLLIVRLGSTRFLSKASAFDTVVAIMLGSIMSRAITESSGMWTTMLCGAVLVALHWLLAGLAYRLDWVGPLVKGKPKTLVEDGRVDRQAMRKAGVSDRDLEQAVRAKGDLELSRVHRATLERDGSISVTSRDARPRVVQVDVANGVQTVRIELS